MVTKREKSMANRKMALRVSSWKCHTSLLEAYHEATSSFQGKRNLVI
jgi:hypothetical protein